jgi:PPP family 3-phenylpropionic acid transporter
MLFAVSPRLDLAYSTLIIVGGVGAALRWVVTAWEPSIAVLCVVQAMHALSFGATHLGTMGLLAHRVPGHSLATAQGYLTASTGLVTAAASIVSGELYNSYGQSIYYGAAAMAALGALAMLAFRRSFGD